MAILNQYFSKCIAITVHKIFKINFPNQACWIFLASIILLMWRLQKYNILGYQTGWRCCNIYRREFFPRHCGQFLFWSVAWSVCHQGCVVTSMWINSHGEFNTIRIHLYQSLEISCLRWFQAIRLIALWLIQGLFAVCCKQVLLLLTLNS